MRIDKLKIRDFRSHDKTEIALDRFNFIVGPNACGKSSIAMAIEFLLTGRCQATDSAGRGADDLVRLGTRELHISGTVGGKLIERTKSMKDHVLRIDGRTGPLAAMQANIYELLETNADVLSAVLNSGRFAAMDEKSQKQLLAQVLASEAIVIPESVQADCRALAALGGSSWKLKAESVADIDATHKIFYELRTDAHREIKALGVLEEPAVPTGTPDYKATWKRLDDLRNDLTQAVSNKTRIEERYEGAVRAVSQKRADLKERGAEARTRILGDVEAAALQKIVDSHAQAERLAAKASEIRKAIEAKERAFVSEKAAKITSAEQAAQSLRDQISAKQEIISGLSKIKGADCPTCLRALPAKDKAALSSRIVDEMTECRERLQDAENKIEPLRHLEIEAGATIDLRADLSRVESEISALGDIPAAEARMRGHREAIVEAARCDRELAQVVEPAAPDMAPSEEKIKELSERIGKGEGVLEQVRGIEERREAFANWKETRERIDRRVSILERLIEFFGPSGIKARIVGDKIGPFTQAMNEALSAFGYIVSFTLEPFLFIVGRQGDGRMASLRQLSESELFRFGIAFQIALAMTTGLKFVVIDRADVLDMPSRGALTGMLLASELDQAIVLSTTDKAAPEKLPAGVRFLQLAGQPVAA